MRNYRILTSFMLKNLLASLNPFASGGSGKKGSTGKVRGGFVILAVIAALASIVFIEFEMSKALQVIRQQALLPVLSLMICMLATLVMGFFQCLSELYQGKDAGFLSVLPLSSKQILTARIATLYVSELALNAVLLLPACVIYALSTASPVPVILRSVLILLFSPAIPLGIVSLLAYLLMHVSAFARHREAIVMALSFVVAIGYSLAVTFNNANSNSDTSALVLALTQENGFIRILTRHFPPVQWGAEGILGSVSDCLLFMGVSILCVTVSVLIAGPGYLTQALSMTETTVKTKSPAIDRKTRIAGWKQQSVFLSQYLLEWKNVLRTPAWMYNSLAGVVMFPLMMGIGFFAGVNGNAGPDGMRKLIELIREADQGWIVLIFTAVVCFAGMVNPAVATAYSREGGRFASVLTWPVRERTRMHAKLAMGLTINLAVGLGITLVICIMLQVPVLTSVIAFLLAEILSFAASAFALAIDLCYPKLSYINEMQAIKQNMHVGLAMALWLGCVVLAGLPVIWTWKLGATVCAAITGGIILLEGIASWILLDRVASRPRYLPE